MELIYGYIFYYFAALIGISIGYHRYFTHRSFKTYSYLENLMLFLGLICGGRSALTWAAVHRMHHAKSDTEHDPHSPVYKGAWNVLTSRWSVEYIPRKYIVDLLKNSRVAFFHRYGKYIHLVYALIMLASGFDLFVSFVLVPFILAWIGFGMLNYFAHKDGEPSDMPMLNFIAPGEGWHKTHHQKPMSTRLHKYDIAGIVIERFFIKPKSSS
jgi:stearoyl-CoA desaturase (delta-9 desaturase)